jgi:hypothetical protein
MKRFYIQNNIGKAKYVVCFHDGIQKHSDGSDFYGIAIYKNKIKMEKICLEVLDNGYKGKM